MYHQITMNIHVHLHSLHMLLILLKVIKLFISPAMTSIFLSVGNCITLLIYFSFCFTSPFPKGFGYKRAFVSSKKRIRSHKWYIHFVHKISRLIFHVSIISRNSINVKNYFRLGIKKPPLECTNGGWEWCKLLSF